MADPKDEQIDVEEEVGANLRLNDAPGLGVLPDGKLNVVQKDAPRFDPDIAIPDDEGDDDDLSDLAEIEALAKS